MRGWEKRLSKRIEKYEFEVGILEDKEHKNPKTSTTFGEQDLTSFAGGPARKKSSIGSGQKISEVFNANQMRMNTNLLLEPFENKSSDIVKFTKEFLKLVFDASYTRRVENLLQAVVRNPILRGDYGENSSFTADQKGFNRLLIDTAQTFKAIKARVVK